LSGFPLVYEKRSPETLMNSRRDVNIYRFGGRNLFNIVNDPLPKFAARVLVV
jgi:hypothetical protein